MKDQTDQKIARVHPGLGVVLIEFGKKLTPYSEFLEGLRRSPGSLNEAEQDVSKTQLGLIDMVIEQLGGIKASLMVGLPSGVPED